jgi:hypothetical protein
MPSRAGDRTRTGDVQLGKGGDAKQAALFRMTGPKGNLRQSHLRLQPRLTTVAAPERTSLGE